MNRETCCAFCSGQTTPHWEAASVWRCAACGMLFRHPMPTEREIDGLYETPWSAPHKYSKATGGTSVDLARVYAGKLAATLGRQDFRGLRILDFGAGKGEMATVLSELGADVCAVDPYGYAYLRRQGYTAFPTLDDVPGEMAFDGAVTIDVIEHLPTPWDQLRQIRQLLKRPGWVYVATPNPTGLGAMVGRSRWREVRNPTHLVFMPPANLEAILKRCGYTACRRLRWSVTYTTSLPRRLRHRLLQTLALDGELRYLAWTAS